MRYEEEDYLQLSGLQHFAFCRRQWALIHIEKLWAENLLTIEGNWMHKKAHDSSSVEKRDNKVIMRGLSVFSPALGISGQCDVVEFYKDENGISLEGYSGKWVPYPIEYKHGSSKKTLADDLQLCAQAMCLEEMLCCNILNGSICF